MPADEPRARVSASSFTPDSETDLQSHSQGEYLDFYEREFRRVVYFLILTGAGLEDAQDAAQEAFIEAWRLLDKPSGWPQVEYRRAWIRKVALRRYHRPPGPRRKPAVIAVNDVPDLPQLGAGHAEITEGTLSVRAALAALDSDLRAIIALDMDGFSTAEIAQFLEITDQKVRDLRRKGRGRLRSELAKASDTWRER